jgi:hypothetical protein
MRYKLTIPVLFVKASGLKELRYKGNSTQTNLIQLVPPKFRMWDVLVKQNISLSLFILK